ncbi:MAG: hypothetical protein ACRCVA_24310 [Phreatobacter sp.]
MSLLAVIDLVVSAVRLPSRDVCGRLARPILARHEALAKPVHMVPGAAGSCPAAMPVGGAGRLGHLGRRMASAGPFRLQTEHLTRHCGSGVAKTGTVDGYFAVQGAARVVLV